MKIQSGKNAPWLLKRNDSGVPGWYYKPEKSVTLVGRYIYSSPRPGRHFGDCKSLRDRGIIFF